MISTTPTKCRHCGRKLSPRAIKYGIDICRKCANFGSKIREKHCPNCDSILDLEGDDYFCHGCGQVYLITQPRKERK